MKTFYFFLAHPIIWVDMENFQAYIPSGTNKSLIRNKTYIDSVGVYFCFKKMLEIDRNHQSVPVNKRCIASQSDVLIETSYTA